MVNFRTSIISTLLLSGIFFGSISSAAETDLCEAAFTKINTTAAELLAKKALGTKTVTLPAKVDHIRYETRGVPAQVQKLAHHPDQVFRHYAKSREDLQNILDGKKLIAGTMHYVHMENDYFREDFPDITGIFFTEIDDSPHRVGVYPEYFVDFVLPKSVDALLLERGIYLVPGPARTTEIPIYVVASSQDH